MIGQLETQDPQAQEDRSFQTKNAILNGFYAALGGAIFAAAFAFVRSQFESRGEE